MKNNQNGSGVIEVLIIGIVVIAIATVGYLVFNKQSTKQAASSNSKTSAVGVTVPEKINSKTDLQTAGKALDQQQIDNKLDPDQLNDDIKSLL